MIDSKNRYKDDYHDIEKYQIKWLVNFLETTSGKMSIAICSKENKTAFLTSTKDYIKPMIVHDVFIEDNGICEDSNFCLNTNCKCNENNLDKFAAAMRMPKSEIDFDALVKRCNEINVLLKDDFLDHGDGGITYFEKPYLAWVKS